MSNLEAEARDAAIAHAITPSPASSSTQPGVGFWTAVATAVDSSAYKPARREKVEMARLETGAAPYYVLKQPETKTYLRLAEEDYTLWWQMDGNRTIKDLLFYNFMRYGSLPIGRLGSLVNDLRSSYFLTDPPTNIYQQIETQLKKRAPSSRGRRILNAVLHSEAAFTGLDGFFSRLYKAFGFLFSHPIQFIFLLIILVGGGFFTGLFLRHIYFLTDSTAGYSMTLLGLFMANLLVITIHELAHGLTTKHFGRELDRGGFLIYWGFPAFFVDTKDTWLSPRSARIAVSWAGPHSGLILGGLAGWILTAVAIFLPDQTTSLWAIFIYQVGFIAFFSVFVNLNPLLELDGYFILMDWLEMPGLRQRAFSFLKRDFWPKLKANPYPHHFWPSLTQTERIFTLFGAVALVYSTYALIFAFYFWQTRIWPMVGNLWQNYGYGGQIIVGLIMMGVVIPAIGYIVLFIWTQARAGLEWLARRDLLGRPDVLASLCGGSLLLVYLLTLSAGQSWLTLLTGLVHLAAALALIGVARQIPGSRFQWTLWALVISVMGITVAWLNVGPIWRSAALNVAAAGILMAGLVAWFTVGPDRLYRRDWLFMGMVLLLNAGSAWFLNQSGSWLSTNGILSPGWTTIATTIGLVLMTPMLINFWQSRFALPWGLLVAAMFSLPWLELFPILHLPTAVIWFYAALLYLLLGSLARFSRLPMSSKVSLGEREKLINGFSHFLQAMFASYEPVFGGRRLAAIEEDLARKGFLDKDASVFQVADYCRSVLLVAIDRLDDLAGTPFTARVGQAAYDSLPWPEAESLARHVLSRTTWGSQLAREFIRAHDSRAELIRQADVFAGFDNDSINELLAVIRPWRARAGTTIARVGEEATRFMIIESGEVAVLENGEEVAILTAGGYFGVNALLDSGPYEATYRARSEVQTIIIERERFDPLLRADTTLASQVSAGAEERELLKRMPLFRSLSPQHLAAVDARLRPLNIPAGQVIAHQGQSRSHLFIVMTGLVEAIYPGTSGQQVVGRFGPGEHFGEYALFTDMPYQHTYCTAVDTRILLLDEPTFDKLVIECAHMSHYVEQIGSGRLIETRRRLDLSGVVA